MALPGDEFYDSAPTAGAGETAGEAGTGEGRRQGRRNRTYVLPPEKGKAGLTVEGALSLLPCLFPLSVGVALTDLDNGRPQVFIDEVLWKFLERDGRI